MRNKVLFLLFAIGSMVAQAATTATATTPEFRLSIKHDGVRASAGDETLRYSSLWDGGSNETAKVTIAQNATTLVENLTGEGERAWSVTRNGTYNLTHTTYTNGAVAAVLNATFVVTGKDVPFPEGDVTVTGWSGKYDGQPHSITVATKDIKNPTITYAVNAKGPFGAENPTFVTVTNQTVWCVVAAAGYITQTNSAVVNISQGDIGGGGGEEPGPGEIPEGGHSKFDATYVYDGEGHTINTQALFAVTLPGAIPSFSFVKDDGGQGLPALPDMPNWIGEAPAYTNAGKYVVWYRITAPNYSNYVHSARVTITNKPVRVVSAVAHQRYPWNGLVDIDVTLDGEPSDLAQIECTFAATNGATKTALPITTISREGSDTCPGRAWKRRYVWNAAADVGEGDIGNAAVTVGAKLMGVQLWKDGPYWAECNVGATKPEEYGYYFWWGDTVGYTCEGGTWEAPSYSGVIWISSVGKCMSSSPFAFNTCPTHAKTISLLREQGYVDSSGNLVTAYDAARAHLGELWRMPTDSELSAFGGNCTTEWTTRSGVYGRLVTGKGDYATKSIFLPAAGCGLDNDLCAPGTRGDYLSSTHVSYGYDIKILYFGRDYYSGNDYFSMDEDRCYLGRSVRPLRAFPYNSGLIPVVESDIVVTPQFKLSVTNNGVRNSSGSETLRYSAFWDGGTNATAKVMLKQGETVLAENLTGEDDSDWSVTRPGLYTLTHTTYTNSAVAKTLTAQFNVSGVPIDPAEIVVTPYGAVYDGAAHGIAVAGPEGTTVKYCATSNGVYEAALTYTDVCTTQIWYEVSGGGWLASTNSVSLKISPRPVTITSGTKTDFVYDGQPHDFSVLGKSENGFVAGEGMTTTNWATVTTVSEGEVANSFDFAAIEGTKLSNYDITVVTGKIAVVQKDVGGGDDDPDKPDPTKPDAVSRFDGVAMYDGAGHTIDTNALIGAFEKVMIGADETRTWYVRAQDADSVVAPTSGWASEAPVFTNACEEIVWYKVTNPNYADYVHAAKVTVTNRPVTVTSASGNWVFDTMAHSTNGVEVAIGGNDAQSGGRGATALPTIPLIGEDAIDVSGFPSITDVGSKPNAFNWTFGAGTLATNYFVSVVTGTLTVAARPIGDDPANWDIRLGEALKYNGSEQSAPLIQVAFRKPDGNLVDIPYTLQNDKATDAGNYKVKITGSGNYAGSVEKDWAIVERNLTFTSMTTNWVYDGVAHTANVVTVSGDGFVAGEGVTFADFPVVRHVADAASAIENSFTYDWNDGTKAKNYSVKTTFGTVQMAKRAITLTSPTKDKTYDGAALTFDGSEIEAALTGDGGGDGGRGATALPAGESFAFGDFASITEVGQKSATFSVADGTALVADYDITPAYGKLTVMANATEITVTAKSQSWVYDGTEHKRNEYDAPNAASVLLPGDELEVTFDQASVITTPIDGPNRDGVVTNTITNVRVIRNGTEDVTKNYTLAWYPGTLTVTKRPVTLTSKSADKVYDGTPLVAHEVTVGDDGFVGDDGATYEFTGTQTDKGSSANEFSYTLKAGTNASYYDITTVTGTLTVKAADITIGGEGDLAVTLGPSLTYNGLAQLQTVASVTYKGLAVDFSATDNQQTDAGSYELKLTGLGNFAGTTNIAWTLNRKALTLTAGSAEKIYDGAALTASAVTAEGFVSGEGATYTCAGSQIDVGASENAVDQIVWNANTKRGNYAVTKKQGMLTVTARPVLVKSKSISKPYDGTPLTLTDTDIEVAYNGGGLVDAALPEGESFVYGDLASRTEAGQTSATFSIAAGANTKLTNYTITPEYGTITITKSATEIGVTAASASWVYDGETHSNRTYTVTNLGTLQSGDKLVVTFDDSCVVKTPQDGPQGDGKVENRIASVKVMRTTSAQQQVDVTDNYTIGVYPGALMVTKRPVTVTVVGKTSSVTYDGAEYSVNGYEATTEDELYGIAADTIFSGTDEVKGTDAATYAMGLKASDFTNNNDCFEVTYAVTDGKLTIAQADISGDECVITLGANPKYNGAVQTIEVKSIVLGELPVTCDLTGQNATDAGIYTLTVKGTGNFKGEKSTTWSILKRAVTLTSGSASRAYNGQPLVKNEVSVSGDGFAGEEGATYTVSGSQVVAGSSANAFTYALKAGTKAGNYDITEVEGTLTVTKATYPGQEPGGAGITWNVAPDAATWMYDGAEHGVTVTGVPTGVTPVYTGNVAKDAGEYTASVAFVYDADNYEAPDAPALIKWSITQRPVTLMAASKDKPYDGFPLEVEPGDITASGSGYATGECFDYYDRASITDVGETPATFKYRDSATAKVANYVVTVKGGQTLKVTVGGDQISVTADSETWAYDSEEHTKPSWTFVNESKLLAGHEFQIKIADTSKIATPKDGLEHNGIVSNAFEYVKIVETATGKDRTKNYNLFVYEGVLQMTNRVICSEELRVNSEEWKSKIEKTYDGGATQVVVSAALLQPETVRYWCDDGGRGATALPDNVVWRDEPYAFTHATNAIVWFTVAADYYNTYTGKVEVTIAKRPVIVKTPTKSKAYNGMELTFTASEIDVAYGRAASPLAAAAGDGTPALPKGESFVFSDFASITDAGKIDATCSIAAGANTSLDDYDITKEWGTLTVLASADQITVTAKNGEWTYDAQPHELHEYVAENESKLLSGDTLSVTFDPQSVITNPDDGPKSDGVVSNVITSVKVMRGDVDVSKNYSLAWYPGVLKMRNATMTVDDSGFSTTAVYDGDGHTVNVVAPTLLTSPVTVKYGTASDAVTLTVPPDFTDAGTHTVFYQISAKYYDTYSGSATATVTSRPVTLVSGGATRVYNGQPLKRNEVTVKEGSLDFVKSEGFSATCSGSITGVGGMENLFDYELTGGTKSDNYTIKKEYGWLRVTPAPLDPAVVIGVDPVAYEWVYDAEAHPFVVTPTMSEPYKMYYSLTENDESTYSEEIQTFTKATANPVPVYFKLMSANFMPLYGTGTVHITKCPVTPPEIASKVYNGNVQTADVQIAVLHGKEAYRILANSGRIEAGEAAVILMLNDSKNYKWTTTDKSFVTLSFVISLAENAWTTQPSISGWSIKDQPSVPVAAAKFGTVSVTYNGTTKSGTTIKDALAVTEPGIYTAVFVVPADTSWTGLRSEVVFTVSDGGETPLTVKALGYLGVYDGKPHTISVTVTGGDGNFDLTYSESETGPWQKDPPTYVEPCAKTVWYRVTSPNYATMTGKATVTISEAKQETVVVKPEGSSKSISIPCSWFQQYPKLGGSTVQDWQVISQQPSGKTDANGNAMYVWQDYVAGTDPTDLNSRFTATIVIEDGVPVVKWSPALNGDGVKTGTRTYTTLGKVNLTDKEWRTVPQGDEKNYNFFTVTVDMPEGK